MAFIPPPPNTADAAFDRWQIKLHQIISNPTGIVIETTATRTVGLQDNYIICNRAGTITLTLPDPKIPRVKPINVRTWTANTVVSASANVVGPTGGAAGTAICAATAGKWVAMVTDGTSWYVVENN